MNDISLMIVEDDPMVMEVNEGFVKQAGGFRISGKARTGHRALELIEATSPNIVILDIYLPDLDGIQVLKEVRKMGLATDFIMITAASDVDTVQSLLRFGVIDYIIKPFKYDRLKAALDRYKLYIAKLSDQKELIDQDELDVLMNISLDTSDSQEKLKDMELPKGLREITLKQILGFLSEGKSEFSAEQVAEGIGLARVTARRYLDYLEKIGKVKLESNYGSVGRPVNKYKLC